MTTPRRHARLLLVLLFAAVAIEARAFQCVTPREWQSHRDAPWVDANGNFVDDAIEALPSSQLISVILDLNHCPSGIELERLSRYGQIAYSGRFVSFVVLQNITAKAAILLPGREDIVAFVESNQIEIGGLDVSNPAIRVETSATYAPQTVEDRYPSINGRGINIAIVDSGVDDGVHESLPGSRFVAGVNCVPPNNPCVPGNPDDDNGHGTRVAGIALGSGSSTGTFRGIAPEAGLIDVKVLDQNRQAFSSDINRGLEWLIARQVATHDVNVANISINNCTNSNGTDARSALVNRMVAEGTVVVYLGGNCDQCAPYTAHCQKVPEGSAADLAVSVANSNDGNTVDRANDVVYLYSMEGPRMSDNDADAADEQKPDLAAPGTNITAPVFDTLDQYSDSTGTSFSAPHVAGCAALLLQVRPDMNPLSVKKVLVDTAEDRGAAGWEATWGWGLLDCYRAVDNLNLQARTDMGFQDCGGPNQHVCWDNPDVAPQDPSIKEGIPNAVVVIVRNMGSNRSVPTKVNVGIFNFDNGDQSYTICAPDVPAIDPGNTHTVTCPWTPRYLSGTNVVHACLKAEVAYPYDPRFDNNYGQHNVNIQQANSPAVFAMQVVNPTEQPLTMELHGSCSGGECNGWYIQPDSNGFPLGPAECPRTVVVTMEPIDATASREARFDWAIVGVDGIGQQLPLGGVTTVARMGCDTRDLVFPGGTERLAWQGPDFFVACPRIYDVARGPLPILPYPSVTVRGDFSAADCIANDLPTADFGDAKTPLAGAGFYYLSRVGGSLPGSWNSGDASQVGSRDDTLAVCP